MRNVKYYSILGVLFLLLIQSSCSLKKTEVDPVEAFRASLTAEDTLTVLTMCDEAMELLKEKKYDKLFLLLNEYDENTKKLNSVSREMANQYMRKFNMFPVLSYEREYCSFLLETVNNVKYNIVFATAEQTGGAPATTSIMFIPIKYEGKWRLCLKTIERLSNQDINSISK